MDLLSDDDWSVGIARKSNALSRIPGSSSDDDDSLSNDETNERRDSKLKYATPAALELNEDFGSPAEVVSSDVEDPFDASIRALNSISLQAYLLKSRREESPAGRDIIDDPVQIQNNRVINNNLGSGLANVSRNVESSKKINSRRDVVTPNRVFSASPSDSSENISRQRANSMSAISNRSSPQPMPRLIKILSNTNELSRFSTPSNSRTSYAIPKDSPNDWLEDVISKSMITKRKFAALLEEKSAMIARLERQLAEALSRNTDLVIKLKNRNRSEASEMIYRSMQMRLIRCYSKAFVRWRSWIHSLKCSELDGIRALLRDKEISTAFALEQSRYSLNLQGAGLTLKAIERFWKVRIWKAWNIWKTENLVQNAKQFTFDSFAVKHLVKWKKRKAFQFWRRNVYLRAVFKEVTTRLCKRRLFKLLENSVRCWRAYYLLCKFRKKALIGMLGTMKRKSRVSRCFSKWRFLSSCVVPQRVQALRVLVKNRQVYTSKVCQHFFYRWEGICILEKSKALKVLEFTDRMHRKVKRTLLSDWTRYNQEQKRFKQEALWILSFAQRYSRNRLQFSFNKWVKFLLLQKVHHAEHNLVELQSRAAEMHKELSVAPSPRLAATIPIARGLLLRSILVRLTSWRLSTGFSAWKSATFRLARSMQIVSIKTKVCKNLISRFQRLRDADVSAAFKEWALQTRRYSNIKIKLGRFAQLSTDSTLRLFLRRWHIIMTKCREFDQSKRLQVNCIRRLVSNREWNKLRHLALSYLLRWKLWNQQYRLRDTAMKKVIKSISKLRIGGSFYLWRRNADHIRSSDLIMCRESAYKAKMITLAFSMMQRLFSASLSYYVEKWRQYISRKKNISYWLQKLCTRVSLFHQRAAISNWKLLCLKSALERRKLTVLFRLINRQLSVAILIAWKRWQVFCQVKHRYAELVIFLGNQMQSDEAFANRQTVLTRFNAWKLISFQRRLLAKSHLHGARSLLKTFESSLKQRCFELWRQKVRRENSVSAGIARLFHCIQNHHIARHFTYWKIISNKRMIQSRLLETVSINVCRMVQHRAEYRAFCRWVRYNRMTKALIQRAGDKLLSVKCNRSRKISFYRWRRSIIELSRLTKFAHIYVWLAKLDAFRKWKFRCMIAHSVLCKLSPFFSFYSKHTIRVFWLRWKAVIKLDSLSSRFIERLCQVQKKAQYYNIRTAFFRLKSWSKLAKDRASSLLHIVTSSFRRCRGSALRQALSKWNKVVNLSLALNAAKQDMITAQAAIDILQNIPSSLFSDSSHQGVGDTAKELLIRSSESISSLAPNMVVIDVRYWDVAANKMMSCRECISSSNQSGTGMENETSTSTATAINRPPPLTRQTDALSLQTSFRSPQSMIAGSSAALVSPDTSVYSLKYKSVGIGGVRESPLGARHTGLPAPYPFTSTASSPVSWSKSFTPKPSPYIMMSSSPLSQPSPSRANVGFVPFKVNPLMHEILLVDAIKAVELREVIIRSVDVGPLSGHMRNANDFVGVISVTSVYASGPVEVGLITIPLFHRDEAIGVLQLLVNTTAEMVIRDSNNLALLTELLSSKPSMQLPRASEDQSPLRNTMTALAMDCISLPPTVIPAFGALVALLTNIIYDQLVVAQPLYVDMKHRQALLASTELSALKEFTTERSTLEHEISVAKTRQSKLIKKCERYKDLAQSWKDYSDSKDEEMRRLKKELRMLRERSKEVDRLHSVMKRVSQMALEDG